MNTSAVQRVTVLGATGSIGSSTLDVIARHPARYQVFALTAFSQVEKLFSLCCLHKPQFAVVDKEADAKRLRDLCRNYGLLTEVLAGEQSLQWVARHDEVDVVMAAIVGAAGLLPSLAAAQAGKKVLLANKEALVMSGSLFMQAVANAQATLLPIDSEHNAIFQSLPYGYQRNPAQCGVRRVLLTASGGPFRTWDKSRLASVTPEQAVAHPNWSMGRKISVDSATLMNKGLEVIEAHWLFNVPAEQIEVVVHPQSMIHSMVDYIDGSVVAELGNPDMRTPIAHALAFPERIESGVAPLNLTTLSGLTFEAPDTERFPCLSLAFAALKAQGTAPAILNAANEVAVAAFLERKLSFTGIPALIQETLNRIPSLSADSLEVVLEADAQARRTATQLLAV